MLWRGCWILYSLFSPMCSFPNKISNHINNFNSVNKVLISLWHIWHTNFPWDIHLLKTKQMQSLHMQPPASSYQEKTDFQYLNLLVWNQFFFLRPSYFFLYICKILISYVLISLISYVLYVFISQVYDKPDGLKVNKQEENSDFTRLF